MIELHHDIAHWAVKWAKGQVPDAVQLELL